LCKFEIFKEWMECFKRSMVIDGLRETFEKKLINHEKASNDDELKTLASQITYHEAKQMADEYQKSKVFVYKSLDESGLGKWITKPFEQNHFTISN